MIFIMDYENVPDDLVLIEKSKYIFLISELERLDKLTTLYKKHYEMMERHFHNVNNIMEKHDEK